MATSEILPQTLHTVTVVKLVKLDRKKTVHEFAKQPLLENASSELDNAKRALLLIDQAEKPPTMTKLDQNPLVSVGNFRRLVEPSKRNASVSDPYLCQYETAIRNELDIQSNKYKCAALYGKVDEEWISVGKTSDAKDDADYVPVGPERMHKQRATWKGYVLHAKETDSEFIARYLKVLFKKIFSKGIKRAFDRLRDDMENFQEQWVETAHFDVDSVMSATNVSATNVRIRSDVLSHSKRPTFTEFLRNEVVIAEITDVLILRMDAHDSFTWERVSMIEQRRQLNGRYRFYPDEGPCK